MKDLLPIRNVRRRKVLLLAGLLVLGSSVSAAAPTGSAPSFAPVRSYATGAGPVSVAIGDLNGDGKPDLATANFGAGTVSVLLNRGDGSFEGKRDYPTGRTGELVEIADLNGDDKSDLVNLRPRSISVLLNQGAGTFAPAVSYAIGRLLDEVVIGDLNGDAKPDLVTGGSDSIMVSVLLNHGDGTFEPKRDYLAGRSPVDIALDDVNADAKPDLVLAHDDCCVAVLLNGGDGSFETRREYERIPFPRDVEIGDLNGDGKMDIATANYGDPVASVLLNRGDGSFGAPRSYGCGSCNVDLQTAASAMAIADLNGDDKADLVTVWTGVRYGEVHEGTEDVAGVSVRLNKGNGSFFPAHSYELDADAQLATVDLNGDGKPDIATAGDGALSVRLNKGNGRFESSLHYPTGGDGIADLNSDGKPDIVAAHSHTVSVRLNAPGLCNVQWVDGMTVAAAKRTLGRVNCRVGKVSRSYSTRVRRGRVISQKPKFGAVLPGGGKVKLVVSKGRK
jgi:hypothetical protein